MSTENPLEEQSNQEETHDQKAMSDRLRQMAETIEHQPQQKPDAEREKTDADINQKIAERILGETITAEEDGLINAEIIEGPEMPLRVLQNKLEKGKPTVLLMHGSEMNEYAWAPVLQALEAQGINAVTFAFRGCSPEIPFDAEKFKGTGLMDYVADADCVVEYLKKQLDIDDKDLTIAGHSGGAVVNTFLGRNRQFKKLINFGAGYPNQEALEQEGVDVSDKDQLSRKTSSLLGIPPEFVKIILEQGKEKKFSRNCREAGRLKSTVDGLFNTDIPQDYPSPAVKPDSLEFLMGPSSSKTVADALFPDSVPTRQEIPSPMEFVASTDDQHFSPDKMKNFAKMWGGKYAELPGPHVLTYSQSRDALVQYIADSVKKE